MSPVNIFWFRRDLRIDDNAGLYHALSSDKPVLPIFIFDKSILNKLEDKDDARVSYIHDSLVELDQKLGGLNSSLKVMHSTVSKSWKTLINEYTINAVYTNKDYEPYAISRDKTIEKLLSKNDIPFYSFKDHVIFEKDEVLKSDNSPYTVYTPYKRRWLEKKDSNTKNGKSLYFKPFPSSEYADNFVKILRFKMPTLADIGFKRSDIPIPPKEVKRSIIKNYTEARNFPALNGTSRLGIHFRFGTISIRDKVRKAVKLNDTYLSELIWRDFYAQILAHFPHVVEGAFRSKYDKVEWRTDEAEFNQWCRGGTGYPIVDAGMRELNATGHMHNRVRMIVASFLTKHLLIDWRWGEAYFARRLLDFDLASNNGGWQWAAGCGTDAAPYFRIFNPTLQMQKFDKELRYVKKWVPEYGTDDYPLPMVVHKFARERCLRVYKDALS